MLEEVAGGLGQRLAGVSARATAAKDLADVASIADEVAALGGDALVAVGGGGSIDTARGVSALLARGLRAREVQDRAESGDGSVLADHPAALPIVAVPSTFAGADLSARGSISIPRPGDDVGSARIRVYAHVRSSVACFDPWIFEASPRSVLGSSFMNAANKGLETLYSPASDRHSDLTAFHGLRLMSTSIGDGEHALDRMRHAEAVFGLLHVQMNRRVSVIHAFGHGFSRVLGVHQGVAHAALAPVVLRHLLGRIDCRRDLLAGALGIDSHGDRTDVGLAIVGRLERMRDVVADRSAARHLRRPPSSTIPAVVEAVVGDRLLAAAPRGVTFDRDVIRELLEEVWSARSA